VNVSYKHGLPQHEPKSLGFFDFPNYPTVCPPLSLISRTKSPSQQHLEQNSEHDYSILYFGAPPASTTLKAGPQNWHNGN